MHFRVFRYFTRPALIAADRERQEAGIRDRHEHPDYDTLPKKGPFVVKSAFPFLEGNGDRIPQVHCVIMWAEGGLRWEMDVTLDRFRHLPKMMVENPHAYRI